MLLSAGKSVLLVVDVQERLAPSIAAGDEVTARVAKLVRGARLFGVPVLASEQYPKGLGRTVPAILDLLEPGEVVEKIHFSCADEPGFVARLRGLDRPQVVVCGMEAHVCVLQTALGVLEAGFDVFLASDAAGSRAPENRAAAIERMRAEGVRVATAEMVLFEWIHRADVPRFKDALSLIK
jgi:nicotinamidase-related amidase